MSLFLDDIQLETLRELSREDRAEVLVAVTDYILGEEVPAFTGSKLIMFRYLTISRDVKKSSTGAERIRRYRERKKEEARTNSVNIVNVNNSVNNSNVTESVNNSNVTESVNTVNVTQREIERRERKRKEAKEKEREERQRENTNTTLQEKNINSACAREATDTLTLSAVSSCPPGVCVSEGDFFEEEERREEAETETEACDATEAPHVIKIASLSLTAEQAKKLAEAQKRIEEARKDREITSGSDPDRVRSRFPEPKVETFQMPITPAPVSSAKTPEAEAAASPEPYAERKARGDCKNGNNHEPEPQPKPEGTRALSSDTGGNPSYSKNSNKCLFSEDTGGKPREPVFTGAGEKAPAGGKLEDEFARLWEAYPRKIKFQAAYIAYCQARASASLSLPGVSADKIPPIDELIKIVTKQAAAWADVESRYIPALDKWLRDKRWTDEAEEIEKETEEELMGGMSMAELDARTEEIRRETRRLYGIPEPGTKEREEWDAARRARVAARTEELYS